MFSRQEIVKVFIYHSVELDGIHLLYKGLEDSSYLVKEPLLCLVRLKQGYLAPCTSVSRETEDPQMEEKGLKLAESDAAPAVFVDCPVGLRHLGII